MNRMNIEKYFAQLYASGKPLELGFVWNKNKDNNFRKIITKSPSMFRYFEKNLFPSTYQSLLCDTWFKASPNSDFSVFTATLISIFSKKLNLFVLAKEEYEKNFMKGEYEAADESLKLIKKQFGVSCWLVQQEAFLRDKLWPDDPREVDRYILELTNNHTKDDSVFSNPIMTMIAYKTTKTEYSKHDLKSSVKEFGEKFAVYPPRILNFFLSFLDPLSITVKANRNSCLKYHLHLSFIDTYLYFKICSIEKAYNSREIKGSKLPEIKIHDKSLYKYRLLNNDNIPKSHLKLQRRFINLLELYTRGEYQEVFDEAVGLINQDYDISYLEPLIKSSFYLDKQNIKSFGYRSELSNVAQNLLNLFSLADPVDLEDSYRKSFSVLFKYPYSLLGSQVLKFFTQYGFHDEKNVFISEMLDPYITERTKTKIIQNNFQENIDNDTTYNQLFYSIKEFNINELSKLDGKIPPSRFDFYNIYISLKKSEVNFNLILDYCERFNNKNLLNVIKIINQLIELDTNLRIDSNSIVNFIADELRKKPNLIYFINLKQYLTLIDEGIVKIHSLNYNLVYLLMVYSNTIDMEFESLLKQKITNFRAKKNITSVRRILDVEEIHPVEYLTFLIKNSLLNYALQGVDTKPKLMQETIESYNILHEFTANDELLVESFKEFERYQVYKDIEEYDKGRLFVDADSIWKKHSHELKKNIQILIDLATNKINLDELLYNNKSRTNLYITSIYRFFVDKLFDDQHGLHSSLSLGIRHGFFKNRIIGVFNSKEILIPGAESKFTDQIYPQLLYYYGEQLADSISITFSNLVKGIERDIDSFINSLCQRKSSSQQEGMFDYTLKENDLIELNGLILSIEDLKKPEIFSRLTSLFWSQTTYCTAKIKNYLEAEFKHKLNSYIDKTELELIDLVGDDRSSEVELLLESLKKSKTEIHSCIQALTHWFEKIDIGDIQGKPRDLNYLIRMSKMYLEDFAIRGIKIDVRYEGKYSKKVIDNNYFHNLVTILNIILINLVEKTSQNDPTYSLELCIDEHDKNYLLIFKNKVELTEKELLERSEKIKSILKMINLGTYSNLISKESGTGIAKIHKLLKDDMKVGKVENAELLSNEYKLSIYLDRKVFKK